MLSDIEIAQNAKMLKIKDIAKELGIDEEELIPYGHYKAKISQECIDRLESKEDGKLILVTAINPLSCGRGQDNYFRRSCGGYVQDRQKGCTCTA